MNRLALRGPLKPRCRWRAEAKCDRLALSAARSGRMDARSWEPSDRRAVSALMRKLYVAAARLLTKRQHGRTSLGIRSAEASDATQAAKRSASRSRTGESA